MPFFAKHWIDPQQQPLALLCWSRSRPPADRRSSSHRLSPRPMPSRRPKGPVSCLLPKRSRQRRCSCRGRCRRPRRLCRRRRRHGHISRTLQHQHPSPAGPLSHSGKPTGACPIRGTAAWVSIERGIGDAAEGGGNRRIEDSSTRGDDWRMHATSETEARHSAQSQQRKGVLGG
jgi:hypothetical protein